jgi:transcriptional regulator with XRE-family HTH domain
VIAITGIFLPVAVFVAGPAAIALCADIAEARRRSGLKQDGAADLLKVSTQRLSEAENGKSPLDVRRLAEFDRAFWVELIDLLADRHGITVVRDDIVQILADVRELLAALPDRHQQMAKAVLPAPGQKEQRTECA